MMFFSLESLGEQRTAGGEEEEEEEE